MRTATTIEAVRAALCHAPRPIGFVPTMGFLHEGHLSLVRQARAENETIVVSIFVNPTQFGPNEDFSRYPRDLEHDSRLLAGAGVDLLFVPAIDEIYPPDFDTYVTVGGVSEGLEGAARPGHFRGVTTVVTKLFNIVRPDRAYFGKKDAQQVAVIQKLVRDLALPVEIVPMPTVREPDGLAMSSRNVYLAPEDRRAATAIYRALTAVATAYAAGDRTSAQLKQRLKTQLMDEPRLAIEYISIADAVTLRELESDEQPSDERPALISLAVRIGKTRLIDNLTLPLSTT